jgi:hypothetical protein
MCPNCIERSYKMNINSFIMGGVICTCLFWSSVLKADGTGEQDERIIVPLTNAGIGLDEKSLIEALKNTDRMIASRAAIVLSTRKKSVEIIDALAHAASEDSDTLAVTAMRSLFAFGDISWCSYASKRLKNIKNPAIQIEVAELLAKAGTMDGWDVIVAMIRDPKYVALALESIDVFDNKMKSDGKRINVSEELRSIALTAPGDIKAKIMNRLAK